MNHAAAFPILAPSPSGSVAIRFALRHLNAHGEHGQEYGSEWITSPTRRPFSLSLPITSAVALKDERVCNFFDDLHPNSQAIWVRVATRFKTDGADMFDVL